MKYGPTLKVSLTILGENDQRNRCQLLLPLFLMVIGIVNVGASSPTVGCSLFKSYGVTVGMGYAQSGAAD